MTKTFTKTTKLDVTGISGLEEVNAIVERTADYHLEFDFSLSASDQKTFEVLLPDDQVISFVAAVTTSGISGDLNLLTGDPQTPDKTIPLKTSAPFMWDVDDGDSILFDEAPITMLTVVNDNSIPVNVKVRALLNATD